MTAVIWGEAVRDGYRVSSTASCARQASAGAQSLECVFVVQQEPVIASLDEASLRPAAHDADAGLDRRTGQVRQLLS